MGESVMADDIYPMMQIVVLVDRSKNGHADDVGTRDKALKQKIFDLCLLSMEKYVYRQGILLHCMKLSKDDG